MHLDGVRGLTENEGGLKPDFGTGNHHMEVLCSEEQRGSGVKLGQGSE